MTTRQRGALAATGLGLFLVFLDAMIANLALPEIQADLGGGEATMQWVVVSYSVGMALAIMPSGTLADRRGRRAVYQWSVVVFALASVASGAAPSVPVLAGARFVQGLAAAAISVTSLALVSATFPDRAARARAIGTWNAIAATGLALGPTLGGVLAQEAGWRWVFLLGVPVTVAVVALTARFVDESRDGVARAVDVGGQALFAVAVVALSVGVVAGPHQGWGSPVIVGLLMGSVAALVAFVAWELTRDQPMMDVRLFRDGTYAWSIAAIFSVYAFVYGTLLLITQYWQDVRGYQPIEAGALLLPFAAATILVPPHVGRWVGRVGPLRPARLGMGVLVIGGGALIAAVHVDTVGSSVFLVLGLGMALVGPSLTSLAMSRVADDRAGMASGIFSAQRAIGSSVGYALMGSLLAGWLSRTLDDRLAPALPDAAAREAVAASIIDQANPYAFAAEIGPGAPIAEASDATRQRILALATDDFLVGIQLSLAVGAALVLVVLVVGLVRGGRPEGDAPSAGEPSPGQPSVGRPSAEELPPGDPSAGRPSAGEPSSGAAG